MSKTDKKAKAEKAPEKAPEQEDQAPEQEDQTPEKAPEQEPVTFKSTRYPQVQVQIKGRTLREGPKFVAGEYTTDDPEEIDVLDGLDYTARDEK